MKNIRIKLLIPTLLMVAFSLAGIVYVSFMQYLSFQQQAKTLTERHATRLKSLLSIQQQKNSELIHLLSNKWHFIDSVTIRNMNVILDEIIPYYEQMNYGLVNLYDKNGITIARADLPGVFGKSDELSPLVLEMKTGQQTGFASMYNGKLALLSMKQIVSDDEPIGVLVVGNYLDQKMVDDFAHSYGVNVTFYLNDKEVVSSIKNKDAAKTGRQLRTLIDFSDQIVGTGSLKALLIEDYSAAEKSFWSNLFAVMFVISAISAVIIIFSRRTIMSAANALDNARISAEEKTLELEAANNKLEHEITERKRAEEALRKAQGGLEQRIAERTAELAAANESLKNEIAERKRAEEFVSNILETVDEGFIVVDRDYRVISANRAFCETIKLPIEDVIGANCYAVSHRISKPCYEMGEDCAVRHTFITGEPHTAIHTHRDREGNPVYVETKAYPLKDTFGNTVSAIEIIIDITEKRKLEEQLRQSQKMEAIGQLAGGIAHDFNNMLTAIIGYASLLNMNLEKDSSLKPFVDKILSSAEKSADLTRQLLAFSRKQIISLRQVDLNELIKGMDKLLQRVIGEDIELKTILADKDLTVMADPGQIEQVLMNLSTNARDAMPNGGLLSISTEKALLDKEYMKTHDIEKPGMYALIAVTDTGIGLDAKTRQRIFEPFFTTKELGKGTGLGLSIVYGIIKQHNGNINVYSEPGKGTTFKIYLPITESKIEETKAAEVIPPTSKGGTETILIAEDNEEVRMLTKNVLEGSGYKVIEAVDGEDAINKFEENKDRIQLIVIDVIMPKKSGKEACDEIRKIRPDIKVLFTSGYTADIINKKGILETGLDFISKPVTPRDLLIKVRAVLDKK